MSPPATRTDRIAALLRSAADQQYGDKMRRDDVPKSASFGGLIAPEQGIDTVFFSDSERADRRSAIGLRPGA